MLDALNHNESIEDAIANREFSPFWHRVILCSLTAHLTLLVVFWIEIEGGKQILDGGSIRGRIIVYTLLFTWLFLFAYSPFLYRRAGVIAAVGWVVSVLTILSSVFLPAYV